MSRGPLVATPRKAAAARAVRAQQQACGRRLAQERDASYALGCMLHWAEGDKCRNGVRMSNSDPELLAVFAEFLRSHFDVRDTEISIYCNLFADHVERQNEIERFWLDKLRLPPTSLRKSVINNYSKHSQRKRRNKLPYGTCTVAGEQHPHSADDPRLDPGVRRVERPEWLD